MTGAGWAGAGSLLNAEGLLEVADSLVLLSATVTVGVHHVTSQHPQGPLPQARQGPWSPRCSALRNPHAPSPFPMPPPSRSSLLFLTSLPTFLTSTFPFLSASRLPKSLLVLAVVCYRVDRGAFACFLHYTRCRSPFPLVTEISSLIISILAVPFCYLVLFLSPFHRYFVFVQVNCPPSAVRSVLSSLVPANPSPQATVT